MGITDILKSFEEAMASAAFAEAGEFEMARQLMTRSGKSRKKVLLGTSEENIDPRVVGHALKLCQRVEAGLEILHVTGSRGRGRRAPKSSAPPSLLQKMGIVYSPVKGDAPLEQELVEQVSRRRDILCVVVDAGDEAGPAERRKLTEIFRRLHCPLVLYGEGAEI